jgi:CRISPR/Cas system-associated exonuclease Cas4 (RecB family)
MKNLDENIKVIWGSRAGGLVMEDIVRHFDLSIGEIAAITMIINDLYFKRKEVKDLFELLKNELNFDDNKTVEIALDILGKRLLIADQEWFEGEVSKMIISLGGRPIGYSDFVHEYRAQMELEREEEERLRLEAEKAEEELPIAVTDPEKERKAAKQVFSTNMKTVLESEDFDFKNDVNRG